MPGQFLSLGGYVARASIVHGLDGRAKLAAAVILASAAALSRHVAGELLVLGILAVGFALARLPLGIVARAGRGALWFLLFVALANGGWYLATGESVWAGGAAVWQRLGDLGVLLLRLLDLLLLMSLVTATTVPVEAAEALERLLRPLGRLRLPVHELGLLFVLALAFTPVFVREAEALAAAHRLKSGSRRWGAVDRLRAVVPLGVPLFLGALRRADDLAVALDARCFVPGARRSSLVPAHAGRAEAVVLIASAAVLAGCLRL